MSKKKKTELRTPQEYEEAKKEFGKVVWSPPLPGVGEKPGTAFLPVTPGATEEPVKKGKYRRSGHLTDQILKYTYPKDKSLQLSIWDSLGDTTQKQIEALKVERTEIVEGIKLSPSEQKIIDTLCKLLHEKSQTLEQGKDEY